VLTVVTLLTTPVELNQVPTKQPVLLSIQDVSVICKLILITDILDHYENDELT
jgi:hypothetical protein